MNILLISLLLVATLCSCSSKRAEQENMVSLLVGREIVMPDNLACKILNDTIDFNLGDADYTVVNYFSR